MPLGPGAMLPPPHGPPLFPSASQVLHRKLLHASGTLCCVYSDTLLKLASRENGIIFFIVHQKIYFARKFFFRPSLPVLFWPRPLLFRQVLDHLVSQPHMLPSPHCPPSPLSLNLRSLQLVPTVSLFTLRMMSRW